MIEPEVSQWYKLQDDHHCFEVLALSDDFLIVQLEGGNIEEYSLEQWAQMLVVPMSSSDTWAMRWDGLSEQQHESLEPRYHIVDTELSQDFLEDDFDEDLLAH